MNCRERLHLEKRMSRRKEHVTLFCFLKEFPLPFPSASPRAVPCPGPVCALSLPCWCSVALQARSQDPHLCAAKTRVSSSHPFSIHVGYAIVSGAVAVSLHGPFPSVSVDRCLVLETWLRCTRRECVMSTSWWLAVCHSESFVVLGMSWILGFQDMLWSAW